MRTRSASKNEPFLMLCEDRKSSKPQDFDEQGHYIGSEAASKSSCRPLKHHCCDCASNRFLTRLNFLIAGCLILLIALVIGEMTDSFDARPFINSSLDSLTTFATDAYTCACEWIQTHCCVVCVVAGIILLSILVTAVRRYYSGDSNSKKQKTNA